jgi:hypothetical protein
MSRQKVTQLHRWTNCMADIYAARNGAVALDFLEEVVQPAFAALQARTEHFQRESEADISAAFAVSDLDGIQYEMGQAFALSVQSIWERQIRRYIAGCAETLKDEDRPAHVQAAQQHAWEKVEAAFFRVRGIQLADMPGYDDLSLLHLLGNVCRHGPGKSAEQLFKLNPELWPWSSPGEKNRGNGPVVSLSLLTRFTTAIQTFWEEAEYIHAESIVNKHPSLEARLQLEREERARGDRCAK